jgi:hypothetical protein
MFYFNLINRLFHFTPLLFSLAPLDSSNFINFCAAATTEAHVLVFLCWASDVMEGEGTRTKNGVSWVIHHK